MTTVYGLVDPRSGAVRYVGRTTDVQRRFRAHMSDETVSANPTVSTKRAWINELSAAGLVPELRILEKCEDAAAPDAESNWIRSMAGPLLINQGPYGNRGRSASTEEIEPTIGVTIRFPLDIHRLAKANAVIDGRSLTKYMVHLVAADRRGLAFAERDTPKRTKGGR